MHMLSSGQIREAIEQQTGEMLDREQVMYAIRKARVQPIGRAGPMRLFSEAAVAEVKQFLDRKRRRSTEENRRDQK